MLIVTHHASEDEVDKCIPGHRAYLEKFHARGVFVASGPSVPRELGGAIIATGVSRAELDDIIAEDEFVRQGVSSYRVVTINVRRQHPAMEALLEQLAGAEASP
ncbi:YciI family protein [Streptomyces olivaceiscleroticus]|uniref:YciI family protein n=1 Tax=Streptomyces olivaceiscleroticus TaxID=68245 RepID=UPI0031F836AD